MVRILRTTNLRMATTLRMLFGRIQQIMKWMGTELKAHQARFWCAPNSNSKSNCTKSNTPHWWAARWCYQIKLHLRDRQWRPGTWRSSRRKAGCSRSRRRRTTSNNQQARSLISNFSRSRKYSSALRTSWPKPGALTSPTRKAKRWRYPRRWPTKSNQLAGRRSWTFWHSCIEVLTVYAWLKSWKTTWSNSFVKPWTSARGNN